MTAPGQPQTGPLPVSPENIEQRARWRTGLGQLPTGSFYLGTRRSPSLQCPLLRRHGPPFWDLHSGAWGPHILTLTVGMALRDVPFSLPPPRIHISIWRVPEDPTVREARGTLRRDPEAGEGRHAGAQGGFFSKRVCPRRPIPTSVMGTLTHEASRPHGPAQEHGGSTRAFAPNWGQMKALTPDSSSWPLSPKPLAPEPRPLGPLPWGS